MNSTPWISYAEHIVTDPSYVRRIRLGVLIAAVTAAIILFQSIWMNSQPFLMMAFARLPSGTSTGITTGFVDFTRHLSLVTGILYIVGMLISIWLLTAYPKEDHEGFSPNLSWALRFAILIHAAFRIVNWIMPVSSLTYYQLINIVLYLAYQVLLGIFVGRVLNRLNMKSLQTEFYILIGMTVLNSGLNTALFNFYWIPKLHATSSASGPSSSVTIQIQMAGAVSLVILFWCALFYFRAYRGVGKLLQKSAGTDGMQSS